MKRIEDRRNSAATAHKIRTKTTSSTKKKKMMTLTTTKKEKDMALDSVSFAFGKISATLVAELANLHHIGVRLMKEIDLASSYICTRALTRWRKEINPSYRRQQRRSRNAHPLQYHHSCPFLSQIYAAANPKFHDYRPLSGARAKKSAAPARRRTASRGRNKATLSGKAARRKTSTTSRQHRLEAKRSTATKRTTSTGNAKKQRTGAKRSRRLTASGSR